MELVKVHLLICYKVSSLPDTGKVTVGDTIVFGYYSQKGIQVADDKRVIEVVKDIAEFIPLANGTSLSASGLFSF